jgi:alkanesulfonate monooxygenase SsuD/methylene tetrahydromethanopterin reductase-like flavin-dependent oxidoreductase (luciferase family)
MWYEIEKLRPLLLDGRIQTMAIQFCLHGSARTIQAAVDRAKRAEAFGFEAIFFADSHMNNVDPYQVMAPQ